MVATKKARAIPTALPVLVNTGLNRVTVSLMVYVHDVGTTMTQMTQTLGKVKFAEFASGEPISQARQPNAKALTLWHVLHGSTDYVDNRIRF
jgi:hypothetical protein